MKSVFEKIRASTRSKFLSFLPVHTKTLNYSGNTIASLTGHVLCDEWNHRQPSAGVFKKLHAGDRFRKRRLRVNRSLKGRKNLRFEKYPDTCERGLRVFSVCCKGASRLCSLRKIQGSPVIWTCEIQGTQHMICMKKLTFSSRSKANVGHQAPPGSPRAPPWAWFLNGRLVLIQDLNFLPFFSILPSYVLARVIFCIIITVSRSWGSTVFCKFELHVLWRPKKIA